MTDRTCEKVIGTKRVVGRGVCKMVGEEEGTRTGKRVGLLLGAGTDVIGFDLVGFRDGNFLVGALVL